MDILVVMAMVDDIPGQARLPLPAMINRQAVPYVIDTIVKLLVMAYSTFKHCVGKKGAQPKNIPLGLTVKCITGMTLLV